jgi:hypothetical protein
MKHLTLGLGILIGHIFIRQFYTSFAMLFVGPKFDRTFQLVMLSSELAIIIGILIAAWLIKKYQVVQRLPENPQGLLALKIGVYTFMFTWVIFLISRLIPFAVYFFGSFEPLRYVFMQHSDFVFTIANLFIGYGLFLLLLSAKNEDS